MYVHKKWLCIGESVINGEVTFKQCKTNGGPIEPPSSHDALCLCLLLARLQHLVRGIEVGDETG